RVGDAIFKFVSGGAESFATCRIDGATIGPDGTVTMDPSGVTGIVGGHQLRMLIRALQRVAKSEISVIVLGESGTGKELFARELHVASGRRGAFAAVNCAAIPATLLESELFGYKRGAFSGADRDKVGLVKAADGGTLFLDEIGDMPLDAHAKLLRVLQSREIIPVGATAPERVDVRIVCATHRNLAALQKDGRFRGDLYARLNEYSIALPPLRERKEDVYSLVKSFLAKNGRSDLGVGFPFMTGLLHYDWPFNVRELEATIKRAVALAEGPVLTADHLTDVVKNAMREYASRNADGSPHLEGPAMSARATAPPELPYAAQPGGSPPIVGRDGRIVVEAARPVRTGVPTAEELRGLLTQHKGNVAAVGREFGKERMQVHRWMKRYGIDVDQYR
ncbi:MAG TPA: sigma 54-interacting transcriptional regulator, partial [Polyangiaceae bacterium]|nr:sigma 54-interacting transcriptional regulator [Polyangiaceae bacterium]